MKQMGLGKSTRFDGEGLPPQSKRKSKSSTNDACGQHPYMRNDFWKQARNQFWLRSIYSEESREYLSTHITV